MSLKSIQMLKKMIFALLATLVMAGGILFYMKNKNQRIFYNIINEGLTITKVR